MIAFSQLIIAIEPRYEATGWQTLLSQPSWLISFLVLLLVASLVTLYSAKQEQTALPAGRGKWLALIRLLALVGVGCLLAGWERRPVTEQTVPSRVILLTDGSTSMGLVEDHQDATDGSSKEIDSQQPTTRSEAVSDLLPMLTKRFAESHKVIEARFGSGVVYRSRNNPELDIDANKVGSKQDADSPGFYAPRDAETRMGEALESVLEDHKSLPLAAVVLLTDGRSTGGISPLRIADEFAERGVLIHTVGLGPTVEPKRVQIRGMTVPSRVYAGDPFEATVRLAAQGEFEGQVSVELLLVEEAGLGSGEVILTEKISFTKDTPIVVKRFEIDSPPPGRYRLITRLIALGKPSTVAGSFESVDQKTSVLLLASGPLRDYRFLRDQLFRDESFTVDAYLQSASSGISQDVRTMLDSFPADSEQLDEYDVVVAHDANWEEIGEASQQLLQQWVLKKGGGLLVVKGASFASQLVEQTPESAVGSLLPVRFLEDPLTLAIESATQSIALPIQLTSAGEQADFMQLDKELDASFEAWQQLEGFYDQPLEVETKLGATIYASLGESTGADQDGQAMLVDQYYGAGRVGYLSTAEMWRLRSIDTNWFTAFYTRLLRHLARGRLQGTAAAGSLFFDRDQYQVGQTMSVRLTRRENSSAGSKDAPIIASWTLPTGKIMASPMQQVEGQTNSYRSSLSITEPGEYRIQVRIPLFDSPLPASAMAILPPLESANQTRNESLLKDLSEKTSAIYCPTIEDALSLIEQTPSQSEVRLLLGEVDKEYSTRMARYTVCTVVALLCLEWLLRRLWRLA